jgi:hypothetical protein
LKVEPVDKKLRRYKSNWLQLVTRMNNNRMPEIMLIYKPNGQRRLGRFLKRLLDEAKTGLLNPNSWHAAAADDDDDEENPLAIFWT